MAIPRRVVLFYDRSLDSYQVVTAFLQHANLPEHDDKRWVHYIADQVMKYGNIVVDLGTDVTMDSASPDLPHEIFKVTRSLDDKCIFSFTDDKKYANYYKGVQQYTKHLGWGRDGR